MISLARPTPRIPNRVYYTKRCWPGCHTNPSQLPHPTPDEFEGALDAGWTWINEDPTHWTLTEVPGMLRIVSQAGSISGDFQDARNILVRDAPDTHFDAMVKATFNPTSDAQNLAIFVKLDDGSLVSLNRWYCAEGEGPSCVGSGVYFDGSDLGCTRVGRPTSKETVHLMLRRAGNAYIGYLLEEGQWIEVGRCNSLATPTLVGLTAINGADDPALEIPADFDSFLLQERP